MSIAGKGPEAAEGTECRACLQIPQKAKMYSIYQTWSGPVDISGAIVRDLTRIAGIEIPDTDRHSKVICEPCCIKLHSASQFIAMVQKSDRILKLRRLFIQVPFNANDKIWPKPITVDGTFGATVEVKQEVPSDDDYPSVMDDDSSIKLDIKVEPEEISQPLPIQVTVNGTISMGQMNAQNSTENGCETFDEEYLDAGLKEEPMSEDEEQVPADLSLDCMLCAKGFYSVSGLKAHVIAHHSYKSVRRKAGTNSSPEMTLGGYVCATCRRRFATSTDLMVHETCHNKAVCYGCTQKFDTFDQLTRHRRRCKAAGRETPKPRTLEDVIRPLPEEFILRRETTKRKENLKCSLCTEEFSDSYYMKIHHEIHHSGELGDDCEKGRTSEQTKSIDESGESRNQVETENLKNMFEQNDEAEHEDITMNEKSENAEHSKVISENSCKDTCNVQEENIEIKTGQASDSKESCEPSHDSKNVNAEERNTSQIDIQSVQVAVEQMEVEAEIAAPETTESSLDFSELICKKEQETQIIPEVSSEQIGDEENLSEEPTTIGDEEKLSEEPTQSETTEQEGQGDPIVEKVLIEQADTNQTEELNEVIEQNQENLSEQVHREHEAPSQNENNERDSEKDTNTSELIDNPQNKELDNQCEGTDSTHSEQIDNPPNEHTEHSHIVQTDNPQKDVIDNPDSEQKDNSHSGQTEDIEMEQ